MTVQEIHNEVFLDIVTLKDKMAELNKNFRKFVLSKSKYPVSKFYDCYTMDRKNQFIIGYTALKRSQHNNPINHFLGIYSRPEGKYAIAPSIDIEKSTIYPPHFFKRYRERIIKNDTLTNDEIIKLFFKNEWGHVGVRINKDFENIYHAFEDDPDGQVSTILASSQGYCFGLQQGNINIIKTIISEDMLFDDQKSIFMELRKAYNKMNYERFGVIV